MNVYIFLYIIFAVVTFFCTISNFDNVAVTPKQIYECNNFNMFGCVFIFIVGVILNPLFYIAHFIYWAFHVGRKE